MSTGFFEVQLSHLDDALLELSGTWGAKSHHGVFGESRAEWLMLEDHRRLLTELRACRDSLNDGVLRRALTRLLARHELLAAQLRAFAA